MTNYKVTRYDDQGETSVWGCKTVAGKNLPLSKTDAERLARRLRHDEAIGVSSYSVPGRYIVEE